jgi:hypothetical protein
METGQFGNSQHLLESHSGVFGIKTFVIVLLKNKTIPGLGIKKTEAVIPLAFYLGFAPFMFL